jgi:hypothetical protein
MSSSHCVGSCLFVLVELALAASCGPEGSAPDATPDATPPSTIPARPAGRFALTSTLDLPVPPAADLVIAGLVAATDGPDDPSRYIVDRMIATLPDGTLKTIAASAAPYAAAYLNERLIDIAPRFVAGIDAIAGGLSRIATHAGTIETLQIDDDGAAIRTITAARFQVGAAPTTVGFADAGLADIVVGTHVVLDPTGHVTLGDHTHGWPYGALLRLGLDRAVIASIEPTARDLATALGTLVDCDRLGTLIADYIGFGSATLYSTACRAGMTVIASEIYARIAAIDDMLLALEVAGSADGIDLDGDGTMDELRAGRWSGSFQAAGSREPIDAASFSGTKAP